MHARNCFKTLLLCLALLAAAGCDRNNDSRPAATDATSNTPLEFRQLRPGIWMHTSYNTFEGVRYPSNGLIIREDDHLVMLDPAWGAEATAALLTRIDEEIGLPVKRAFSTHFHGDRTDGVDVLAEAGIEVMAHPLTLELSAKDGGPAPSTALDGISKPGSAETIGSVEVFYPGPGHAADNITVWVPGEKILYGGCAIRELSTDSLGNTADADLAGWPKAVKRLQARYPDARMVIPGHGAPGGSELLDHMLHLFARRTSGN